MAALIIDKTELVVCILEGWAGRDRPENMSVEQVLQLTDEIPVEMAIRAADRVKNYLVAQFLAAGLTPTIITQQGHG